MTLVALVAAPLLAREAFRLHQRTSAPDFLLADEVSSAERKSAENMQNCKWFFQLFQLPVAEGRAAMRALFTKIGK